MTAANHALTGAIIGLSVTNPFLAIPLAFLSHFVLDAMPHFGMPNMDLTSKKFKVYLILEAFLCWLVVVFLAIVMPDNWVIAVICAFTATTPDFMSVARFLDAQKGIDRKPKTWLTRFAKRIQWGERPWGWTIELVYFLIAGTIFVRMTLQ